MNRLIIMNELFGGIKISLTRYKAWLFAAGLALTCFTVNAAVVDGLDLDPSSGREIYSFSSNSFVEEFFDDYYAISFEGTRDLTGSLEGWGSNAVYFSAFDLLASDRTTIIIDGTVNSGPRAAFGILEGFNLMGGDYFIHIAGAHSDSGGYGGGVSLVSPVPEPEAYGMLLVGLGLIGFIGRRKKNGTRVETFKFQSTTSAA